MCSIVIFIFVMM